MTRHIIKAKVTMLVQQVVTAEDHDEAKRRLIEQLTREGNEDIKLREVRTERIDNPVFDQELWGNSHE